MEVKYCTDSNGVATYTINDSGNNEKITLNYYEVELLKLIKRGIFLSEEEIEKRVGRENKDLRLRIGRLEGYHLICNIKDDKSYIVTDNGRKLLELLEND